MRIHGQKGPLPIRDDNARLEDESLDAFRVLIPKDRLVIRDERKCDYGIDLSLEIVAGIHVTNYRSCAQIRARTNIKENTDGSISLSIRTSTLNYLLNGTCPILILYRKPQNVFRFAFIRDEISKLEKQNPDWYEQGELTVRLTSILKIETIDEICSRIISEAEMLRTICDQIAASNASSGVRLSISPNTLEVTTTKEASEVLLEHGLSFVSHGYATTVVEIAKLISNEDLNSRLHFVLGYAHFYLGEYLNARHHLASSMLDYEDLDDFEQITIKTYALACEFYMGKKNQDEYLKEYAILIKQMQPNMMYQNELIHQRERMLKETDFSKRTVIRENIRRIANSAIEDSSLEERIQDGAQLSLFEIDIEEYTMQLGSIISLALNPANEIMRARFGASSRYDEFTESQEKLESVLSGLLKLMNKASKNYEPRFLMEVWYTRILADLSIRRQSLLINEIAGRRLLIAENNVQIEEILALEKMATSLGNTEFNLRARMLEAQLYDILGNADKANEIAEAVKSISETLMLKLPARSADTFLLGNSSIQVALAGLRNSKEIPETQKILAIPENQLESTAKALCNELGIPEDRSSVVLEGLLSTRKIADMQRCWCKHIGMRERQAHAGSIETIYKEVQLKKLSCERTGRIQTEESKNIEDLYEKFVDEVCAGCEFKEQYKEEL